MTARSFRLPNIAVPPLPRFRGDIIPFSILPEAPGPGKGKNSPPKISPSRLTIRPVYGSINCTSTANTANARRPPMASNLLLICGAAIAALIAAIVLIAVNSRR